jgi:protein-S-isoprenylcysteine O-methyltransferase Ste14
VKLLRAVSVFLTTGLMYLGLPILGWGLDGLRGFFADGPRLGYALAVAALGIGVAWQTRHGMHGVRGGKGEPGKLVRKQTVVRYALVTFLFAALAFLGFADRRSLAVTAMGEIIRWGGTTVAAAGFGLVFWSGVALGRQYSPEVTIQEDHQLITAGAYRVVRHPRYLGVMLTAVGVSLLFRSWAGLLLCPPLLGVLLDRIKDEEAVMHREFGAAWERYCRQSWRLVPYLY